MTVNELIDSLQDLSSDGHGEREVRLAFQPEYPLEYEMHGVAVCSDTDEDEKLEVSIDMMETILNKAEVKIETNGEDDYDEEEPEEYAARLLRTIETHGLMDQMDEEEDDTNVYISSGRQIGYLNNKKAWDLNV